MSSHHDTLQQNPSHRDTRVKKQNFRKKTHLYAKLDLLSWVVMRSENTENQNSNVSKILMKIFVLSFSFIITLAKRR